MKKHLIPSLLAWLPILQSHQVSAQELHDSEQAAPDQQLVCGAALEGDLETVVKALENGYKVNQPDPSGRTAIMYASYNGHTDVVKELLLAGAEVNLKDEGGSTALMFASSGPFRETVTLLLEKGAEINAIDNNEHFTALMWAAAEGQADIVKLLLERGADITLKDIDGDTAESFAAKAGKFEVVQLLKAAAAKSGESGPSKEKQ